jgi:hypothetical protein
MVARNAKIFGGIAIGVLVLAVIAVAVFLLLKYKFHKELFMVTGPMYSIPSETVNSSSPYIVILLNAKMQRMFLDGLAGANRLIVSFSNTSNIANLNFQSFTIPKGVYYQVQIVDISSLAPVTRPSQQDKNWVISSTPVVTTVPPSMQGYSSLAYVIWFK